MTRSSVIKRDDGSSDYAVPFSFDDMARAADKYLAEVRAKTAKIVSDAQRQADEIRRRAEQQGKQAAQAAAERTIDERVRQQMQTALPALRAAIEQLCQAKGEWQQQWEAAAIRLAVAIAGRVLRRRLPDEPAVTLELVREALELAAGSARVIVHLSAEDHATLAGQAASLVAEFARLATAEIVADSSVAPGGCRVETQFGTIDQRFEAQLARIEEELM
jgi:flagellar assembly protein FliH